MMYREYFNLNENPFKLSPDPKYFIFSRNARGVYDQINYGLKNGLGFMMVTGEVGVGKTSLLRFFLQHLDDSVERALIFNPALDSAEQLLKSIIFDLGIRKNRRFGAGVGKVELLSILYRFLLDSCNQGKKVLLFIDEAQCLSDALLEEIRLLSNFETNDQKLLHILLTGQPELKRRIDSPNFRQLNQRIAIKSTLLPLEEEEVGAYIRYRLMVAGSKEEIFSPKAIKAIFRASRGIPRLINLIAERSLIAGYVCSRRQIGKKEVKMAIRDLDMR